MEPVNKPFRTGPLTISTIMLLVIAALAPGSAIHIYLTGWGGLANLLVAAAAAMLFEYIVCVLRNKPVRETMGDHSALLTGLLIGLCLPPLVNIWIPVIAAAIAILLAKHIYGGLGNNIFNPAMVGYAAVLVSFPRDLSLWPTLPQSFEFGIIQTINIIANGGLVEYTHWDSLTGATTLDTARTSTGTAGQHITIGLERWTNIAFLCGGAVLLRLRLINWHIPVSLLATLSLCALIEQAINPNAAGLSVHLLAGATMLGAFFIATDPVSAAAGNTGRLIYGAGIGLLIWLIRTFGGYPDAVAFAVLLMNCTVPVLDYLEPWRWRK